MKVDKNLYLFTGKMTPEQKGEKAVQDAVNFTGEVLNTLATKVLPELVEAPKVPARTMEHMHRTLDAIEAEFSPEQLRRVCQCIKDISEVE